MYPVRGERQVRLNRQRREPLAAPAGEIRHEHVVAEVQLGLVDDQPAARAVTSAIERTAELDAEDRRGARMRERRPRRGVELAVEHLRDVMLRDRNEIVVSGAFLQRLRGHGTSLTPGAFSESTTNLAKQEDFRWPTCPRGVNFTERSQS
jgi:hypothetical protein